MNVDDKLYSTNFIYIKAKYLKKETKYNNSPHVLRSYNSRLVSIYIITY